MLQMSKIKCLKGEFEAEGLSRDSVAAEASFAARHGLPYLVKIGGCEAKSDIRFLQMIGVTSVVAPMIESPFAMRKYQDMLPDGAFAHVGVTIETIDAVTRIEAILAEGYRLTEVTVGRTDLTASFGGSSVDGPETIAMFKTVARAAKARGLPTTMGGSINSGTIALLREDRELRDLTHSVETRKCVMTVDDFLTDGALEEAFAVETTLLDMQLAYHGRIVDAARARVDALRARL